MSNRKTICGIIAGQDVRATSYPRRVGMTLVELLVSITILVILILAFATIIKQSRDVVGGSQATMRENSTATAIAQVLQQDFARLTKTGFLCITAVASTYGTPPTAYEMPLLLMSTAGPNSSMTNSGTDSTATGAIVSLGECRTRGFPKGPTDILWRADWLLQYKGNFWLSPGVADISSTVDMLHGEDLADMQTTSRTILDGWISWWLTLPAVDDNSILAFAPAELVNPPANTNDVIRLWKYLATNCSNLSITWTDGTTTNNVLNWYGPPSYATPKDSSGWAAKTIANATTEYNSGPVAAPLYRALWTHENMNNWPKAVKIRFTLSDPAKPVGLRDMEYEVICPIGH